MSLVKEMPNASYLLNVETVEGRFRIVIWFCYNGAFMVDGIIDCNSIIEGVGNIPESVLKSSKLWSSTLEDKGLLRYRNVKGDKDSIAAALMLSLNTPTFKSDPPSQQQVFVVTGNDYPESVFKTLEAAEKGCAELRPRNKRIHWRVYDFNLKD